MIKALKRLQLKRRGLMTEKTRRTQSEREWVERIRESSIVRASLFIGFVAGLFGLIVAAPVDRGEVMGAPGVALAIALLIFIVGLVHFYVNHPRSFKRNSRVILILGAIMLQLLILRLIHGLAEGDAFGAAGSRYGFLLAPLALAPMVVTILLGRTHALFVTVLAAVWSALLVDRDFALPMLIAGLVVGFVAVLLCDGIRKRSQLMRAGFMIGLTVALFGLLFGLIATGLFDSRPIDGREIGMGLLAAFAGGLITSTVVGGVLPLLESMFRITTSISWIELTDLNHPLLRRMTLEAPGTYHHSLVVANLAEAAAESIGANATMCRVCAYFHDIGKLVKPEYFIENIGDADNPHDDLTPTMSALVITAHVKEGVDLAIKNKLAAEIIDVIEQHHGTSLVYFFYRRALEKQEEIRQLVEEEKAGEEDVPEVSEKSFRYPGPRPQFKESGIISLADAIESASRSLQKPTPTKITQLIEDIINSRIRDGQLADCDLTMKELGAMSESFNATLRSMLHSRIKYPKEDSSDLENGGKKKASRKKSGSNGSKSLSGSSKPGKGKKSGALLP